jgi:hypothetical protein
MGTAFRSLYGFSRVYDLASLISWERELNSEIDNCHGDMPALRRYNVVNYNQITRWMLVIKFGKGFAHGRVAQTDRASDF